MVHGPIPEAILTPQKDILWMVWIMGLEDSHTLPISCITSPQCLLLVSYHLVNSANTTVNRMVRWHKYSEQGTARVWRTVETVVSRTFFLWPQWSQETPYHLCKLEIQTLLTTVQKQILSWASYIQSIPSYTDSVRSSLILSSQLCLHPKQSPPFTVFTKILYEFLTSSQCSPLMQPL